MTAVKKNNLRTRICVLLSFLSVKSKVSFHSPRKMRRTTTPKQFEVIVDFMQNHSDLAMGFATSMEAKIKRRQMWIRLTDKLNDIGPPARNCMEWKSIWSDYKYNIKKKLEADLKLVKRKKFNKRLPFTKLEEAVIGLLRIKNKNFNFNQYKSEMNTLDPVIESSAWSPYNPPGSDVEIDEDQKGIIITDDFDSKISVSVINNPIQLEVIEEKQFEMPEEMIVPETGNDTLMSMHKTQQEILKQLKELNRHHNLSNNLLKQQLQIEQEKLDEQKQQNFEQNKQAYIRIELKRRELELYELNVSGLCTVKKEID